MTITGIVGMSDTLGYVNYYFITTTGATHMAGAFNAQIISILSY